LGQADELRHPFIWLMAAQETERPVRRAAIDSTSV
jgi:hypothetical protein